jgi:hypothetical protein
VWSSTAFSNEHGREVNMYGHRHPRHRRPWRRIPNREQLLSLLEERQRDLEEEIADIHDLIRRLRDEAADAPPQAAPAPSI